MNAPQHRNLSWAVGFAIVFPTLVTWLYFVSLADAPSSVQQLAYSIGKALQFAFPLVWVFGVERTKWQLPAASRRGLAIGLVFGALVAAAMWLVYRYALRDSVAFAEPAAAIRQKVTSTGFTSTAGYFALGAFYVVFHSLLEEYYWRWFVFRKLAEFTLPATAVAISSVGFMAHHVILLATYFGWDSPLTYLFSLGVVVGGAVWAVLYRTCGSLLAPWLSHAVVDAAIFTVGYDLVRELLN